jgi:hypothetical protein
MNATEFQFFQLLLAQSTQTAAVRMCMANDGFGLSTWLRNFDFGH